MLTLILFICAYKLFLYLSQCAQEEQQQLVYWDSAIEMDDSCVSDSFESSERGENAEQNNLIVNYLPECTTQNDLQNMFQGFGTIVSCRLIRHKTQGHSLGYGFVKFERHEDAQAALDQLNGLMMKNKKIKVSFARPASEPIKTANLYISGLKNTITESELVGVFSPFGKVLTVKVMHNDNDATKTSAIGFVRFENHDHAVNAIEELSGKTPAMNPGPIHVSFAKQNQSNAQMMTPLAAPVIGGAYPPLSNFPPNPRYNGFTKAPPVIGKNFRFDPINRAGVSRNGVADVYPVETSTVGYPLFVYNLSPEVEELHLWRLFGPFGAVRHVNVVTDKVTGQSKGFAFITMSNFTEAENAILQLHQTMLEGKVIQVSFKKAKK